MSKNFNIELPINSLSIGQVSYGLLNELFERGIEPNIFPIGGNVDLSAFIIKEGFVEWLQNCIRKADSSFRSEDTSISLWHIQGSHKRISNRNILWTFHETDQLTASEQNILSKFDVVLAPSLYTKDVFSKYLDNVQYCPPFFDELHFFRTDRSYKDENTINFALIGKLEKRKHTIDTMVGWANKYANNPNFKLNACIYNAFIPIEEQNNQVLRAFGGKLPANINILPFQEKNTQLNDLMNKCDVHISCSGAEGWSLPIFNALCLGKQVIAMNAHSHKDFCDNDNSILIDPTGMDNIYDKKFFQEGANFNQGKFFLFSQQDFHSALDKAVERAKERNVNGEKLKDKFSVSKTVDTLLNLI